MCYWILQYYVLFKNLAKQEKLLIIETNELWSVSLISLNVRHLNKYFKLFSFYWTIPEQTMLKIKAVPTTHSELNPQYLACIGRLHQKLRIHQVKLLFSICVCVFF